MAGPWKISQNKNLSLANAITGGVQNFVSAYQGQQNRNRDYMLRLQELETQKELRALQVAKLKQELGPVEFSLQKFRTIENAFGAGIVPEKMKNEAAKEVLAAANTPQKLKFLNSVIDRKKAADLKAMSSSEMAENFGTGTIPMDVPEIPQEAASAPTQMDPVAEEMPTSLNLSPKEADFYGNLVKSKYGAQAQFANVQQREDASKRQFEAAMAGYANKLAISENENETKQILTEMRNEFAKYQTDANNQNRVQVQSLRNQGSKDVANVNAQSREKAANINAASRERTAKLRGSAKGSSNPQTKLLERQIVETQKTLNSLYKPSSGFSMETPRELEIKKAGLQTQLQQLQAAYKTATGFDYGAAVEKGSQQVSSGNVVKQGNPLPKFASGPGVSEKIKALPEGSEFEVDGKVFLLKGGKAIPR